ncbi:glycyl-tRNA synthetase beta chain [Comamonas sp. BIGb0124]|uniref:glycine--tRNA ligase subunit beta n=1 Tax=Comamonas sp. BIGb0124 TaxID=2485130 RepID=UPI000F48B7FB|nr:glycine--tRNA ligase subunit beta [Comamonas sp. BIGb0124]ROR22518.1 glycyl-tRNA synthetase beta chain [Comamonas sp. BIGb0124]
MTDSNLLVELFVEELPPKALRKLGDAFAGVLFEQLKAQGLTGADSRLTAYASPRRLAAHITEVASQAADKAVSQKLMPVAVGLDAAGAPSAALLKKLAAIGADAGAAAGLRREGEGKAEALYYDHTVKGATLSDGLQKALDEAIARLPIPKVMTYQLADGWSSVNFVRPAHNLVAVHGTEVLLSVGALGLKANNHTHGHRFEALVDPIVLRSADDYAEQLREQGAVIAGFDERRADIVRQLQAAAERVGGGVRPIDDDALLDEVTALVERPNVLVCQFEKEFLDVPQECLILTMKANQKYFPLLDVEGRLTHQFLVVSNISPGDASAVTGGNERVIRPRLADAKFFYDQDRKKSLADRVPGLAKVVYHNKLGTQGDRVERVRAIARAIGAQLDNEALAAGADLASQLAKADLLTDMVGEFPELQGIMGGYYARHDGLPVEVAEAIEDHYKPRFAGDALPRSDVGAVAALADKLETLAGMFGIGNLPTGDKDPFALRRHALGVIRILAEQRSSIELGWLLQTAFGVFASRIPADTVFNDASAQLAEFIYDRLAGSLREQGYSAQEVEAVLAQRPQRLAEVQLRLDAVRAFAALPEAAALAEANKRVSNILKKNGAELLADTRPTLALLQAPEEIALLQAMNTLYPQCEAKLAAGDYTGQLRLVASLHQAVDAFFQNVMVMADDPVLRQQRLALLSGLQWHMSQVADLSRLAA